MALYLIGDVQGCDAALGRLLANIGFSPSRDQVFLLGDLVNRGPDSAGVLRRAMAQEGAIRCILGNHDLSLLAVANGTRRAQDSDTHDSVLQAPDRERLLLWLRQQPLALDAYGWLLVHAGVLPSWPRAQVLALAAEAADALAGPGHGQFLAQMYGNQPDRWHDNLSGIDRLRVIINALTRLRFCTPEGVMADLKASGPPAEAPKGMLPWYEAPRRRTAGQRIAFGHWSSLGYLSRADLLALDTGCVWGRALSAMRLHADGTPAELIQLDCA